MSRRYEIHITVRSSQKEKDADIAAAIEDEWNVSDSWEESDGGVTRVGTGNLTGGESEEEFSRSMRDVIWRANEAFCEVEIACTYLENPPMNQYTFDEENYEEWKKVQCPAPGTKS